MRQMDLRALHGVEREPGKGHKIYPYLLRDLSIERANQAWASDISYIPMAKGFMYLVAIMDWYSRVMAGVEHPSPPRGSAQCPYDASCCARPIRAYSRTMVNSP